MERDDVLENALLLPRAIRNKSINRAMVDFGYLDAHDSVSENAIRRHLEEHPELVAEWVLYSEDQRCSPAFYVLQTGKMRWTVGWVSREGDNLVIGEFDSPVDACAMYIKRALDSIRANYVAMS